MSGMKRNVVLALAVAAAVAAPGAFATNGYFSHGYSLKEKGLAGAGTALPQDSLASATNPAGMAMVGERMDFGAALFSPMRSYTTTGGSGTQAAFPAAGSVDSDNELFLIPHFGSNWNLDANSALGFSIYANGGMNTKYKASDTGTGAPGTFGGTNFGDGTAGVDLAQMFFNLTYARKMSSTSSWGASAIFAYQRFKAYGIQGFSGISNDGNNLSNKGYDDSTGFGLKLGVQGEVTPGVTLGAAYQTEMSMGEFDKYKGLFAENGGFDIPATASVGLAWKATPDSVFTLDIQKIYYSKVPSIANPLANGLSGCTALGGTGTAGCLGGANGAGFGWQDMTIYKLGYEWKSSPDMTWRVGYSQGDQPIPQSEVLFNILAPAVIEKHVTFGLTKQVDKKSEFTFALMYAPEDSVKGGPGATVNPFNSNQTIELTMDQYEVGASWGMKF